MSTRTLKVFNSKTQKVQAIDTNVKTWGGLIPLINDYEAGAKGVLQGSKISYEFNDSVLPDTDGVIFLVPTKGKSGKTINRINNECRKLNSSTKK